MRTDDTTSEKHKAQDIVFPTSSRSTLAAPTSDDVARIATKYGITLSEQDEAYFVDALKSTLESYRRIASLPAFQPEARYPRTAGRRPEASENELNAWYWLCDIKGSKSGKLHGKTIALKDNICVAGVPMSNGSPLLEGFVPPVDASVVTRILDAGGAIVGKATCENLCLSGSSNTATSGCVRNPHAPEYSAGGSSSGAAALVAVNACDMAVGCDQGGSIRVPSSICGTYGLKPTFGLVPYTGIFPIESTLDHAGPISQTVEDAAVLLEVLAGPDGLDPRQQQATRVEEYSAALGAGVVGIRVGVLEDGFDWPDAPTDGVDAQLPVRKAIEALEHEGAVVSSVRAPIHREGVHITTAIQSEGFLAQVIEGGGFGTGWKGYYPAELITHFARATRLMANDLPDTAKLLLFTGHYMRERYGGRFYARAQNLVIALRKAYDDLFVNVDLVVMPTCAPKALPYLLPNNSSASDVLESALHHHWNTCPFNMTGHPAMSVPCGIVHDFPVGVMLVGRPFEESLLLRVAHVLEELRLYEADRKPSGKESKSPGSVL